MPRQLKASAFQPHVACDAVGQLGIGAGRRGGTPRPGGEAVADHDAGRGRAGTRVRAEREVTSQLDAVGQDRRFQTASILDAVTAAELDPLDRPDPAH